jgi:hypothetical protein
MQKKLSKTAFVSHTTYHRPASDEYDLSLVLGRFIFSNPKQHLYWNQVYDKDTPYYRRSFDETKHT